MTEVLTARYLLNLVLTAAIIGVLASTVYILLTYLLDRYVWGNDRQGGDS
jgi:hypothetical protein